MELLPIDNIELSHYLGKIAINNNGKYDIEIGIGCFDYGNDEIHECRRNFYKFMYANADKIHDITSELYNLEKNTNLLNDFVAEIGIINLRVSSRFARFIHSKAFRMTHKIGFKESRSREQFSNRHLFPQHINTLIIKYNVVVSAELLAEILTITKNCPHILVIVLQVKKMDDKLVSKIRTKVVAVSQRSRDFKIVNRIGESYSQLLELYPPSVDDDTNWGRIADLL